MLVHIELELSDTHGLIGSVRGIDGLYATGINSIEVVNKVKMLTFAWLSDEMAFGRASPHTVSFSVHANQRTRYRIAESEGQTVSSQEVKKNESTTTTIAAVPKSVQPEQSTSADVTSAT